MGELVGTFALAQDNAFGQPLESQLRSCLLATWLTDATGHDELCDTVYWVSLLRYIGCTGHAHEVAMLFGDEIAARAHTLIQDAANPGEVMRDIVAFLTAGKPPEQHDQIVATIQAGAYEWAQHNFSTGCEVGDMLVDRLQFPEDVRTALRFTFERWNGNGYPTGARGDDIPLPMRIVHLSHDMEAMARLFSPEDALRAAGERRGQTYDPDLADAFVAHGAAWFAELDRLDPWDAVLDLEPAPDRMLEGAQLDEALAVAADFIDLKSPFMAGHSRRCAEIASDTAEGIGLPSETVDQVRRAALLHEFGTTAIPNSIWDKPAPLTRAERDRVELHPLVTEQMLRRSPALAELMAVAAAHHEKPDGSGYHRRLAGDAIEPAAGILAATDVYVGLTTDRADRAALTTDQAASELRRLATEGRLATDAVDAVLAATGHADQRRSARPQHPAGLTAREVEVLCLAAKGLTSKDIADRLFISPKTVGHHIQHAYSKVGVSTRGAAALWAMQNGLVG